MKNDKSQINLNKLPRVLLDSISTQIHNFTTILFAINEEKKDENLMQIGSGIFMSIGDQFGILTAQHVTEKICFPNSLGLCITPEDQPHHYTIQRDSLMIIDVSKSKQEEFGPDLSFILLSDWNDIEDIRASKSFFHLDNYENDLENAKIIDNGIWFICGTPNSLTHKETTGSSFRNIYSYNQICLGYLPDKFFEWSGFDYIDIPIISRRYGINSFGGMSGGGLWKVYIKYNEEGKLFAREYKLLGVMFYEGVITDGSDFDKFIRCHGWKSICKLKKKISNDITYP